MEANIPLPMADNAVSFGHYQFNESHRKKVDYDLKSNLGPGKAKAKLEYLSKRSGAGGQKLMYIESWRSIAIANEIFGFNGWSSNIIDQTVDFVSTLPSNIPFSLCPFEIHNY